MDQNFKIRLLEWYVVTGPRVNDVVSLQREQAGVPLHMLRCPVCTKVGSRADLGPCSYLLRITHGAPRTEPASVHTLNLVTMGGDELESLLEQGGSEERRCAKGRLYGSTGS